MPKPKLNLDPDHISDFLNEPNFESNTPSVSQLMPPLPCRMTVTLDDVIAYDRNPRRSINPSYESIKESIRNRGLDDEPTITRRAIDEPFMIKSGGNTRLAILGDLFKEYRDLAQTTEEAGNKEEAQALSIKAEEFYRFEWNYKPWEGETNALIGHMAENEERGDMIFIEKAMAVKDLQDIFNENVKKPLSARKLAEQVTQSGWNITHTSVSLMIYTINELEPYLKKALWAGLGRPAIIRLRALNNAYENFCTTQGLSSERFKKIWYEVFTVCDDEELDINNTIRRYADQLISDEIGVEYFTVTAEIDAILSGNKPAIREVPLTQEQLQNNQNSNTYTDNIVDLHSTQSNSTPDQSETSPTTESKTRSGKSSKTTSEPVTPEQLIDLRQQIYIDVITLGMAFDLDHYVNKSPTGLGFFIDPIQDVDEQGQDYEAKADVVNDPQHQNRNAVWLYLKQLSLHNLFLSQGEMVPVEQAVSGSDLTPDVFFTLNSHFHLMRLMDKNLQHGIEKIEKSIRTLLQAADNFYGENALYRLFDQS